MFDLCQCKITQILSKYIVKHTKGLTKNIDLFFFFFRKPDGASSQNVRRFSQDWKMQLLNGNYLNARVAI